MSRSADINVQSDLIWWILSTGMHTKLYNNLNSYTSATERSITESTEISTYKKWEKIFQQRSGI
jgi:hypothetical protein